MAITKMQSSCAAALLLLALGAVPLGAAQLFSRHREGDTVEQSVKVVRELAAIPLKSIPPALLHDAKGVAIFPHIVKAGVVIDKRYGHGVVILRQPDGTWSDPVFVTMDGVGVGLQAGVEATDLVLVFKNPNSLERILKGNGKLTLGSDVSIAAGPVGREIEKASDHHLKADVISYSRSRGLFAGVSLEGARVNLDTAANEAYYGIRNCRPQDVLSRHGVPIPAVDALRVEMIRLSMPVK